MEFVGMRTDASRLECQAGLQEKLQQSRRRTITQSPTLADDHATGVFRVTAAGEFWPAFPRASAARLIVPFRGGSPSVCSRRPDFQLAVPSGTFRI
jgi:hypothetical protein